MLLFSEHADCVYKVIGKQAQYCGGGGGTTVYSDTFETATGWTANPSGTDTATTGAWERGDPAGDQLVRRQAARHHGQRHQRPGDRAPGRRRARVTSTSTAARPAIRSPAITLPATGTLTLYFSQYLAHGSNSSSADFLRVSIVHSGGTTQVFNRAGAATDVDAVWAVGTANLTPYAGQSVRILIEAADASTASLVEAGRRRRADHAVLDRPHCHASLVPFNATKGASDALRDAAGRRALVASRPAACGSVCADCPAAKPV